MATAATSKRPAVDSPNVPPAKKTHWSQGLLSSMNDPNLLVESDDRIVIIKDKYPKARYHFLVIPKINVRNLKSLKREQSELLRYMETRSRMLALNYPQIEFRYGFHAIPSMSQLHLHMISQDFDSPCLKTKRHWNSFNTKYFLESAVSSDIRTWTSRIAQINMIAFCPLKIEIPKMTFPILNWDLDNVLKALCMLLYEPLGQREFRPFTRKTILLVKTKIDVIRCLEERGMVITMTPVAGEKLLDQPLKCHKCVYSPQNMPKLKQHLYKHVNN